MSSPSKPAVTKTLSAPVSVACCRLLWKLSWPTRKFWTLDCMAPGER